MRMKLRMAFDGVQNNEENFQFFMNFVHFNFIRMHQIQGKETQLNF